MRDVVVIVNANARRIRKRPAEVERMRTLMGNGDGFHLTRSASEVDAIAARCAEAGTSVIALAGGDGTNHVTITRIAEAFGDRPLPRFALLGGGTMNIVAGALGVAPRPSAALEAILAADEASAATVVRRLLRVRTHDRDMLGFIFGNGLLVNFLRAYYEQVDPTPVDAARLLARAVWSVMSGGALSQRLLTQLDTQVDADGERWLERPLIAIMASTQEHLGLGFQPFVRARETTDTLHAVAVLGPLHRVAAALPAIRLARPLPADGFDERVVQSIGLTTTTPGPWMLDGDIYGETNQIDVSAGPAVVLEIGGRSGISAAR